MDTFGEVACTERSRAGGSNCATQTEKCTQEGFFPSRKRSCGTRPCAPIRAQRGVLAFRRLALGPWAASVLCMRYVRVGSQVDT
eukprot:scaffold64100_cov54-Phaeocystis_antarctica.AAC.6